FLNFAYRAVIYLHAAGFRRQFSPSCKMIGFPGAPAARGILLTFRGRLRGTLTRSMHTMQGLHLTADLYRCDCDKSLLIDAEALAQLCREATLATGLTIVGEKWHVFPEYQGEPGG